MRQSWRSWRRAHKSEAAAVRVADFNREQRAGCVTYMTLDWQVEKQMDSETALCEAFNLGFFQEI